MRKPEQAEKLVEGGLTDGYAEIPAAVIAAIFQFMNALPKFQNAQIRF